MNFLSGGDDKVLNLDSGNGCMALGIHTKPVNFMVCELHLKKATLKIELIKHTGHQHIWGMAERKKVSLPDILHSARECQKHHTNLLGRPAMWAQHKGQSRVRSELGPHLPHPFSHHEVGYL